MFRCCTRVPEDWGRPDAFYPIKPDCLHDVPVSRFKTTPGKTLGPRRWRSSFSEEGYLDIAGALRRIQQGGVHPTIKGEVWEFLLGCYDPGSTFSERTQLRQWRRSEYEKLKSICRDMDNTVGSGRIVVTPVISENVEPAEDSSSNDSNLEHEIQSNEAGSPAPGNKNDNVSLDKATIQWKLSLHQIGLDVVRTDRTLLFYENPENQARLWDVLAVYSWIDRDIGYCQGMSDLCSPIIVLIENEADAFWCFEHLMRRVRGNFKCTSTTIGVRSQLMLLSSVVKTVDPKLHEHIDNLDGGEYLFAFRMLMVLFRREFSFADSLYLWEFIWSMEYNPNLFSSYDKDASANKMQDASGNEDLKKYGKFERMKIKYGGKDSQATLSVFLVASVIEARNKRRLLLEAKGLDDVVKILNDNTGKLDAKKACKEALKLHRKYINKTKLAQ